MCEKERGKVRDREREVSFKLKIRKVIDREGGRESVRVRRGGRE